MWWCSRAFELSVLSLYFCYPVMSLSLRFRSGATEGRACGAVALALWACRGAPTVMDQPTSLSLRGQILTSMTHTHPFGNFHWPLLSVAPYH